MKERANTQTTTERASKIAEQMISYVNEFGGKQRFEVGHILIAYVPFIGSGMNGNTLGTELFAVECHTQHIGIIATPCIAQGGYLVDIDA